MKIDATMNVWKTQDKTQYQTEQNTGAPPHWKDKELHTEE